MITYRGIYYSIESLKQIEPDAEKLFEPFPEVFKQLYIRGFDRDLLGDIESTLTNTKENTNKRRKRAKIYRKDIQHPKINHPETVGEPVYYRYTLLLETQELRDFVVSYLRERDFRVSTLYDLIHRRFGSESEFPVAESLSKRSLNLWVFGVNDGYAKDCSEAVMEAVEEFGKGQKITSS